ncbi:MAG: carbohydrate ABC transporter permease [Ruminococcaceae bacterium]|nr:carbohydrate ABC transporter permease [Oscillospiraceae bacterium]
MKNMDKGILTNADMKLTRYKLLYVVMFAIMLVYCAASFLPVVWIMLSGFKDVKEMYAVPATFLPKNFDLSKLTRVWNEMKFYKYYGNTFFMALGCVAFDLVISGLAGYVLSSLKPKGTRFMLAVIFWIMLLPGTMRTVPLYMEFKSMPLIGINLLETFWPIWLMAGANAFNIILFKNFFDGISPSLIEAAWIDGCNNIGIFFKIILPLSVPVFLVVAMFTFNGNLGTFFWPYLLISDREKTVIGVQLFRMKTSTYTMDYQMIALIFSVVPQVLIFAIFQKQIMGGVNIGGVKG